MCSATMGTHSNNIGLYWDDKELIMLLVRMAKGHPFPNDVIEDVNPYQYKPSNLPEDFWFYILSDQNKDSEHGFWKARGEPSEICSSFSITGLKTTLEFYEGRTPHAQRTNWVMQEYSVTQKVLHSNNNSKGSNLLCRVFLTSGTIENKNLQLKSEEWKTINCPEIGSSLGISSCQARSRVDNTGQLRTSDGVENLFETECFARGDYLELDDLVDTGSLSFSSDDTSYVILSSDECFDSLALLKDLEDEINKGEEGGSVNFKYTASAKPLDPVTLSSDECFDSLALLKDLEDEINKREEGRSVNFNYTASAKPPDHVVIPAETLGSAKPDDVVIPAVTLGSLIGSNNESRSPKDKRAHDKRVMQNAFETQNVKNRDKKRSMPNSEDDVSSSSSHKSSPIGEKKQSVRKLKKLHRKYLCFIPF